MAFESFFAAIQGVVSKTFAAIEAFLLVAQLVGAYLVEVLLFLAFLALALSIVAVPLWLFFKFREWRAKMRSARIIR